MAVEFSPAISVEGVNQTKGAVEQIEVVSDGAPAITTTYLNAAFRNDQPVGSNRFTWQTVGSPDPTYASSGIPLLLYDFWIEDIAVT